VKFLARQFLAQFGDSGFGVGGQFIVRITGNEQLELLNRALGVRLVKLLRR